jgi:DNA-directed RNA polymerase specialized sigma24 family protein
MTATAESFEGPFVRIARRYSLCDDDAWEAFARALEIIARNRHRIRHETAVAYMAVVVRNEALAVRRERTREAPLEAVADELTGPEIEPDEPGRDPRLPALRAAMRELRPDDRRALLLFHALPGPRRYEQIMRATRWSYAKVNRCLTRGRTRLRKLLATEVAGDG